MDRFLLIFALVGLAGCVTPASVPRTEPAQRPAFDTVTLAGLSFRDERISGRTEAFAEGYGSASARAGGTVGTDSYSGWAAGSSRAYAAGSSRTYETFENTELRKVLRLALENAHLTRRVVNDSPVRIEGLAWSEGRPGVARVIYDILLSLPTGGLFFPWLGSTETTVQLRVYLYDELIGTYEGKGRANWTAPGMQAIGRFSNNASLVAGGLAVTDAVGQMASQAREIAAVVNPGRSAVSNSGANTSQWCSRWSDATRLRQCMAEQRQAYLHLESAIDRLKVDESSVEAKVLRRCYDQAKFTYGTDWVAVENCMRSQAVPASHYR